MSNLFEKLINQELLLTNFELDKLTARVDSRSNDDVAPKDPRLKSTCPAVENRHGVLANPNEEDQYKSTSTLSTSSSLSSKNIQGYTIPKRKLDSIFQDVALSSREFINDVLPPVIQSYRFPQSESYMSITSAKLVHNHQLYARFLERKRSMILEGRNEKELMELYAFLSVGNENLAKKICTEGIHVGNVTISSLGQARLGVCLQKHADILKPRDPEPGSSTFVILFKVIKGRTKQTSEYSSSLEPTPNYDCHVSKYLASDAVGLDTKHLYSSTQLYLYEYEDDKVVERPRHIYPYAILTISYKEKDPSMTHAGSNKMRNPQVRAVLPKGIKVWSGQLYNKLNYISDVNLISFSLFHKPLCFGTKITISQTMSIPKMRLKYFSKLSRISLRRECHVGSQFLLCCQLQADSSSLIFRQLIKFLVNSNQVAIWNCGRRVEAILIPSCLSSAALGFPALPTPECAMHCLFISPYSLAQRLDAERERVFKCSLHVGRTDPAYGQGNEENFESGFVLPIPADSLLKPNVLVGIFEQQAVLQKAIDSYSTAAQAEINDNESESNTMNSSGSALSLDSVRDTIPNRSILKTSSSDSVNSTTPENSALQRQTRLKEKSISYNASESIKAVSDEIISRPVVISHENSKPIEKTPASFTKDRRSQSRDDRKRIRAAIQNQKAPPGIPNILLESMGSHTAEYLSDSDNAAYSPSQFTPVPDLISQSGERQRRHSITDNIQEKKERKSSADKPAEADKLTEAIMNVYNAFGLSKSSNPGSYSTKSPKPDLDKTSNFGPRISKPSNLEPRISKPSNLEPHISKPSNLEPRVNKPSNLEPRVNKPSNLEPRINKSSNLEPCINKPSNVEPCLSKSLNAEPPIQVSATPSSMREIIPSKSGSTNVQNLMHIIHKDPRLARLKNLVPTAPSLKPSNEGSVINRIDSTSLSSKDKTLEAIIESKAKDSNLNNAEFHYQPVSCMEISSRKVSSHSPQETSLLAQNQEKTKLVKDSPLKPATIPEEEKVSEKSNVQKNSASEVSTINKNQSHKADTRSTAEPEKDPTESVTATSIRESETLLSCLQTIIDALNTTTGKKIECSELLKNLSGNSKLQSEVTSHVKPVTTTNLSVNLQKEQETKECSSPSIPLKSNPENIIKQPEQTEKNLLYTSQNLQKKSEPNICDNLQKSQEKPSETFKEVSVNLKDVPNSGSYLIKVIPLESCTSLNLDDPRLRKPSQEIDEPDLDILSDQKTNDSISNQDSKTFSKPSNASKTDLTIQEALVNFHVEESKLLGNTEPVENPVKDKLDFVGSININKQVSLKPIKYAANIEKSEKSKSKSNSASGGLCNQLIKDMEFEMRAEAMSRIWNKVKDFNNSSEVKEVISSTLSINDENGGKLLFDFDSFETTKDSPKKEKISHAEKKSPNIQIEKSKLEMDIDSKKSKPEKSSTTFKPSKETKFHKKHSRKPHFDEYLIYEDDFEKPSKRRKYSYDDYDYVDDLFEDDYEDINYGFQVTDINTMEEIENFFMELSSVTSFCDDYVLSKDYPKENGINLVKKTFLESSSIPEDNIIANLVKRECQKFDVEITNLLKDIRGEESVIPENVIVEEVEKEEEEYSELSSKESVAIEENQDAVISSMSYFYSSLNQLMVNYGIPEEKSNSLENRLVWNSVIHHDKNLSQHCTSNRNLEKKLEILKLELNQEMDRLIAECQNKINNCIQPENLDKKEVEMPPEDPVMVVPPETDYAVADVFESSIIIAPLSKAEAFSKMNQKHQSILERDSNNATQLKKQSNSITICIKQNEQNIKNSRVSDRKSSITEDTVVEGSKELPSLDLACIPLPEECSKDKLEISQSETMGDNSEGAWIEGNTVSFAAAFASSGIMKESSGFAESEKTIIQELPKESANLIDSSSDLYDPSVPTEKSEKKLKVVKRKLRKRSKPFKSLLTLSNKLRQMLPTKVQHRDTYITYRKNLLKHLILSEKQKTEKSNETTPKKWKKNAKKQEKRKLLGKRYLHLENALKHLIGFVQSESKDVFKTISLSTPLRLLLEKLNPSIATLMRYKPTAIRTGSKRRKLFRSSTESLKRIEENSSSTLVSITEQPSVVDQSVISANNVQQHTAVVPEKAVSEAENIQSAKQPQTEANESSVNASSYIPISMDSVCNPSSVAVTCTAPPMGVMCNPPPPMGIVPNMAPMGIVANPPPMGMVPNPPPMGMVPNPPPMGMVANPPPMGIVANPPPMGMVTDPSAMGMVADPSAMGMVPNPQAMGIPTDPSVMGIPSDPSVTGIPPDPSVMGMVTDPSAVNMMNDPSMMGTIPEGYPLNSNANSYPSYRFTQRPNEQMGSGQLPYPPPMVTNDFCINQNVPCPDTNFIAEEEINSNQYGHTGWFLVFGQHSAFCAEAQSYLESQGHRLFDLKNYEALHCINKGEELWVFIHVSGLPILHKLPGLYHIKYLPNCHLMAFEHPQQLPNRNCSGLMEAGGIIVPDLDLLLNITPGVLTRLLSLLERNQDRNQPWIFLMHSHIMKHLEMKASRSGMHEGPSKIVTAILNLLTAYQDKGIVHIMFPHACDSRDMPNPHLACLQNLQERHAFSHRYIILLSRVAAGSDEADHFINSGISVFDTFSLMKKHFSYNNPGML